MQTRVRIAKGRHRGRLGYIAGDLDALHYRVRRVPVFSEGQVFVTRIEHLEKWDQLNLFDDIICLRDDNLK